MRKSPTGGFLYLYIKLKILNILTLILLKGIMNNIKGGRKHGTSNYTRMDCES